MHLGRFHKAIEQLASEYVAGKLAQNFDNLINALNAVAANPGNAEQATAYKSQLENFRQSLSRTELNSPRPVMQTMLASIDAEQYIGDQLFAQIVSAISANPATPSLAAQDLQKLKDATAAFYKNITLIDQAFTELGVEYEELEAGQGELGILIPRDDNTSTLSHLSKEFKDWSTILSPLAEVFDHEAPPLQIRTCATTDWMVYLAATYGILRGVSDCLKGVNLILRELSETRELIEKLSKRSKSPKAIETLEEEIRNKLSSDLRAFAEKIVDENYTLNDPARKNELKIAVDHSLKNIVKKISDGVKIELKYLAPQRPKAEAEEGVENETSEQSNQELFSINLDQEISLIDFSESKTHALALLEDDSENVTAVDKK